MAVAADLAYLRSVLSLVGPDVLEVGSRNWQGADGNMSETIRSSGRAWEGCDLEPGTGVDFQLDILDNGQVSQVGRTWSSVLLFNLLEHVYDPHLALRNALQLVAPGGSCVVCGPAVWELHDYPADYWRPLPDFFSEFARREGHAVKSMAWVMVHRRWLPRTAPASRLLPVSSVTYGGKKQLPSRLTAAQVYGPARTLASLVLQRGLHLTGRHFRFPNVGLGVVLVKTAERGSS